MKSCINFARLLRLIITLKSKNVAKFYVDISPYFKPLFYKPGHMFPTKFYRGKAGIPLEKFVTLMHSTIFDKESIVLGHLY